MLSIKRHRLLRRGWKRGLLLLTFFAFLGLFAQAEKVFSSFDEGHVQVSDSALLSDSDDDSKSSIHLLSATESAASSFISSRESETSYSSESRPSVLRIFFWIRECHSVEYGLRTHVVSLLEIRISACRYAAGYYLYQLCRLLN